MLVGTVVPVPMPSFRENKDKVCGSKGCPLKWKHAEWIVVETHSRC